MVSILGIGLKTQYNLRGPIITSNQILNFWRMLIKPVRSAKITQLNLHIVKRKQEVIGLNICMYNLTVSELMQTHEHWDSIPFYILQGNLTLPFLDIWAQVLPHELANETKVTVLEEVVVYFHYVLCGLETGQYLVLLLPTLLH